RTQGVQQATSLGTVRRVRPNDMNSFAYVVEHAAAIAASGADVQIDGVSNERVAGGEVALADYDAVIWLLGEESTADQTFSLAEQSIVADYLASGGRLMASGAEIGYEFVGQNVGPEFFQTTLHASYVRDSTSARTASGAAGSVFAGAALSFGGPNAAYPVETPDVIAPAAGAEAALLYGDGATAAITWADVESDARLVLMAFPFETIDTASQRELLMRQTLEFFGLPIVYEPIEYVLDNDHGAPEYVETGAWNTPTSSGYEGGTYRFIQAGSAATAKWSFDVPYVARGEVLLHYPAGGNRATDAVFRVDTGDVVETFTVNQRVNGSQWVSLGSFDFVPGAHSVMLDAAASTGGSIVVADAVRVVLTPAIDPSADFNADDVVDGNDFLAWQRGLGSVSASASQGDSDRDQDVDADDLAVWMGQFGQATTPLLQVAAPQVVAVASVAVASDDVAAVDSQDAAMALWQAWEFLHDDTASRPARRWNWARRDAWGN
ncbi:MAG: hypothetical protein KDA61_16725, partial [Planctomycetales bacterium]|nr:hypothetical protein [Planctomycetales bacterium]